MKIVIVHNQYKSRGGEETVFDLEYALLKENGNEIYPFLDDNKTLEMKGLFAKFALGLNTIWSLKAYRTFYHFLKKYKPDIIHVHNTFPKLSPSIYWAANKLQIPVVQTLHNYRFTCANGLLLRDQKPCEACVGKKVPLPALKYNCYRNSKSATAAIVGMQVVNRMIGTYKNKVNIYITLTEFFKTLMVRSGLPEEKIMVKPHFIPDPYELLDSQKTLNDMTSKGKSSKQIVFVGRLAYEKGLDLLLDAWSRLATHDYNLVIIGQGPERAKLENQYKQFPNIIWRGFLERKEVLEEVYKSKFTVISSRTYETFSLVLIEAFALGVPAIVPNHAGFPEVRSSTETGILYSPGNVEDLHSALSQAIHIEDETWHTWSQQARQIYVQKYSPEVNYEHLLNIYEHAIQSKTKSSYLNHSQNIV